MRVRVDKTRHENFAAAINYFIRCIFFCDLCFEANSNDRIPFDDNCAGVILV